MMIVRAGMRRVLSTVGACVGVLLALPGLAADWNFTPQDDGVAYRVNSVIASPENQLPYASDLYDGTWLLSLAADQPGFSRPIATNGTPIAFATLDDGDRVILVDSENLQEQTLIRLGGDGTPRWTMHLPAGYQARTPPALARTANNEVFLTITRYGASDQPVARVRALISQSGSVVWARKEVAFPGVAVALPQSTDYMGLFEDAGSERMLQLVRLSDGALGARINLNVPSGSRRLEVESAGNGRTRLRFVTSDSVILTRDIDIANGALVAQFENAAFMGLLGYAFREIGGQDLVFTTAEQGGPTTLNVAGVNEQSSRWSNSFQGYAGAVIPVNDDAIATVITTDDDPDGGVHRLRLISRATGATLWDVPVNMPDFSPTSSVNPQLFFANDRLTVVEVGLLGPSWPERTVYFSRWASFSLAGSAMENGFVELPANAKQYSPSAGTGIVHLLRGIAGAREANGLVEHRAVLTGIDTATGDERFETKLAGQYPRSLVGHFNRGGTEVAAMNFRTFLSNNPSVGSSLLVGVDPTTGVEKWRHAFAPDFPARLFYTFGSALAPSQGSIYFNQSIFHSTSDFVSGTSEYTLQAYDPATGALRWSKPYAFGPLLTSASGLGVLVDNQKFFSASDGSLTWQASPAQVAQVSSAAANGDLLHAFRTYGAGPHIECRRLNASSGNLSWTWQFVPESILSMGVHSVRETRDGDVLIALKQGLADDGSQTVIVRLDGATGAEKWRAPLPRSKFSYAQPGTALETADGRLDVAQVEYAGGISLLTRGERWYLMTLDMATGQLLESRHIEGAADGDDVSSLDGLAMHSRTADGGVVFVENYAPFGRLLAPRVIKRATGTISGDLRANLFIEDNRGGSPARASFRIEVDYTGNAAIDDVWVRTAFPEVVFEDVSCTIDLGECQALSRLGDVRQHLRMEPGAHATLRGTIAMLIEGQGSLSYVAYADGPFVFSDQQPGNNESAQSADVSESMMMSGFE